MNNQTHPVEHSRQRHVGEECIAARSAGGDVGCPTHEEEPPCPGPRERIEGLLYEFARVHRHAYTETDQDRRFSPVEKLIEFRGVLPVAGRVEERVANATHLIGPVPGRLAVGCWTEHQDKIGRESREEKAITPRG